MHPPQNRWRVKSEVSVIIRPKLIHTVKTQRWNRLHCMRPRKASIDVYMIQIREEKKYSKPFLIKSDLSVENGLFRLKPKSSFLIKPKKGFLSKKGFFDSTFFDWGFRLADPVEKLDFFDWILQPKNYVEKKLHVFFEPIASFIPPPNTHPHGHTATHPYQVPHCSIIQGADAGVAVTAVASRSKWAWRIPGSARQPRVSHDGSSGIDPMLPTTAAPAEALAALG